MRAYIIRRLLLLIPTLSILSVLVFLSVRFIPGDTVDLIAARMETFLGPGAEVDRELIERMLGLDVPVYVQYGRWVGVLPTPDLVTGETQFKGLLQGSLGESLLRDTPITEMILERLPVTIELGVMALVLGLLIALPVGIYSAIRQDTPADYVGRSIAIIGIATPNFWLALMVMIFPAIWWGWSPPMEWVPFHGRPAGESQDSHHSQPDSRDGRCCRHNAVDAHHDAGGAQAGLHQDGLVQGSQGEGSHYETRPQECAHPDSYPDRRADAYPGSRLRYHGEHIQPAGDGSSLADCTRRERLPGGLRSKPIFRHHGYGEHSTY